MLVFDEADEIFQQEENHKHLEKIYTKCKSINQIPQSVLFSATFSKDVEDCVNHFLGSCNGYRIENEALKLRGVQ